ncbi:hypothetical protein Dimus_031346, partial [Dionaea muscipula]
TGGEWEAATAAGSLDMDGATTVENGIAVDDASAVDEAITSIEDVVARDSSSARDGATAAVEDAGAVSGAANPKREEVSGASMAIIYDGRDGSS